LGLVGDGVVGDGGAQQEDERIAAGAVLPALDVMADQQFAAVAGWHRAKVRCLRVHGLDRREESGV
jgi:hypothetical protein